MILLVLLLLCSCAAAESAYSLPVDFSAGKVPDAACYLSETEYKDPSIHVVIETGRQHDCDYWVARIAIAHPSQLRTAAAAGSFEDEEFTVDAVQLAKRQNAVLAVDGDYYAYTSHGYVLRQGVLYKDLLKGERDVLAIDEDGDFHIFPLAQAGHMTKTINGKKVINAMYFGPALVENGEVTSLKSGDWLVPTARRQRMCIAQTGPLQYMALCCAGPARGSYGMDLYQFASLAKDLGAQTAYNLDGGDSTIMIFNNEKINDKNNSSTREISDILYFASAWDGEKAAE